MDVNEKNELSEPIAWYGKTYTYADYLRFGVDEMVELIKGKLFRMSPAPNRLHQEISLNLTLQMGEYFKKQPCKLYVAPFDVVLPTQQEDNNTSTTVVQPDLCVICDQSKLQDAGCFGAPDLIIEILSKSTSYKDLNDKYNIYEEAGVKEYWIVMPDKRIVEVFHLQDQQYKSIYTYHEGDTLSSILFPDLQLNLEEVFPQG